MRITSITIENFKGIRDKVKIDLKPITLLFGPNSAGKSTIIQALHYAWEVIGRHNLDPNFTEFGGREMDLGGFENLVHGHDLSRSIMIRLDMDISETKLPVYTDDPQMGRLYEAAGQFDDENIFCWNIHCHTGTHTNKGFIKNEYKPLSSWVEIMISWNHDIGKPYVSTYEVGIDNDLIVKVKTSPDVNKVYISYINFFHRLLTKVNQKEIKKAFETMIDKTGEKSSTDYARVKNFKQIIDSVAVGPERWLDPKLFSQNEYENLARTINCLLDQKIVLYKSLGLNEIMASEIDDLRKQKKIIKEFGKLNKTEIEQIDIKDKDSCSDFIRKKYEIASETEIYTPFAPYEFMFFCINELQLESITKDFDIKLDMTDALPTWDRDNILLIELDSSEGEKSRYSNDGYSKAIGSALTQLIVGPGQILKNELQKLSYLGPIRSRIPRNYAPNRYVEKRNWPDGLAAWDALHKDDDEIVKKTDYWMADRLNSGYHITRKTYKEINIAKITAQKENIAEQYNSAPTKTRLFLMDTKSGVEVQPPDVGVGISQVIPVIVSALYFKKGIVSIEQPELHIHPALQVTLGDLFISQVKKKDITFLLETHSEHLLLRIMKRIKETSADKISEKDFVVDPKDVNILFFDHDGSKTIIHEIPLDEKGEFAKPWPGGFFEESFKELF